MIFDVGFLMLNGLFPRRLGRGLAFPGKVVRPLFLGFGSGGGEGEQGDDGEMVFALFLVGDN